MKTGNILVIDDDAEIREIVQVLLSSEGYTVETVADGMQALTMLTEKTFLPDVIILDIMMPDMDGYSVCKQIREISQVPIILITAKGEDYERVMGLDIGADDYMTKPFGVMELISRVKALLRRSGRTHSSPVLTFQNIKMEEDKHIVSVNEKPCELTFKEFELLKYLMLNQGIVLSRDKIMDQVWGFEYEGESRTVDMHIKTLRQKLGAAGSCIKTVRNVGYMIE